MTETWNFINTGSHDPFYNMAMDEALLNFVASGDIGPDYSLLCVESCNIISGILSAIKEIDIDKVKRKRFRTRVKPEDVVFFMIKATYMLLFLNLT